MRVLLLGGTAEARELAAALAGSDVDVVSSLAGRVSRPRLPVGEVRVGGFGGVDGLRSELASYDVVVDATHPFATTISASAAQACTAAGRPLLRLARPSWSSLPGASDWHWVDSHEKAADAARELATAASATRPAAAGEPTAAGPGGRVLLTTGRQSLLRYLPALVDASVVARVVDPVTDELPASWTVVMSRGPYTLAAERSLLSSHGVAVLVTKDSGGELVRAKLDAAGELGVPVVVVRRPSSPPGVEQVDDVAGALRWLSARGAPA